MYEYTGVIHVHSRFSDGSGTVPEIAETAREVGLDFVMLTDHNTLRAKDEGYEKFYGDTLLIAGCEVNDKENKNHYLAFGIDKPPSTRIPAQQYVKEVNEQGGIGFIAHPHEKRSAISEHPPYPWTAWDSDDFTGIEIWNHMSEWMENLTEQNKYQSFVHPLKTIVSPPVETLAKWDELSQERRVVGIGGVDAHAHKVNLLGFFEVEVFAYKVLFKSIRTHIITNAKLENRLDKLGVEIARKIIIDALKSGRCFVSNYYHGDASGFRFFADAGKARYQMGEDVPNSDNVKLRVILPGEAALIKLIRNGEVLDRVISRDAAFMVNKSGSYRAEVVIDDKPWIFSNHIRIAI